MRVPAYTLLEVIATIAILTLLTTFIVPTYQLILSQLELNSSVENVSSFIREAEQKTVTQQQIYGLTFVTNATSITLYQYNTANSTMTTISTLTLPTNIIISSVNFNGNSNIQFATSGSPSTAGNIVLEDTVRTRHREIDIRPGGSVVNNQAEY